MGVLTDRFGALTFANEAEVSQNFIIPLITEFLGYELNEIVPEWQAPARWVNANRDNRVGIKTLSVRPDFLVSNGTALTFIVDSKGPNETINDHLDQLYAYAIAFNCPLLLISNGRDTLVHALMHPVLTASSIQDLDVKLLEFAKLLSKPATSQQAFMERVQNTNLAAALSTAHSADAPPNRLLEISDYIGYLSAISQRGNKIELPPILQDTFEADLIHVSPDRMFHIVQYLSSTQPATQDVALSSIIENCLNSDQMLVGESGIGRTLLCHHVARALADSSRKGDAVVVPVIVSLSLYSSTNTLRVLLTAALQRHLDEIIIRTIDIERELRRGRFVLICDAYDEVPTEYLAELERELALLQSSYTVRLLLTSREGRLPALRGLRKYRIKLLSVAAIWHFANEQMGPVLASAFMEKLRALQIESAATSTLILTLMILLFKTERDLPANRFAIVESIVDLMLRRQAEKLVHSQTIPMPALKQLLGALAMNAAFQGDGYILTGSIAVPIIQDSCNRLAAEYLIDGLTPARAINCLTASGFVHQTPERTLVFWHRAFMEHFAITELASLINDNNFDASITSQYKMQTLVSVALSKATNADIYERVFKCNALCLAEALNYTVTENPTLVSMVIPHLEKCSRSAIPQIALLALKVVARAPGARAEHFLRQQLDNGTSDQKVIALRSLVQRKVPDARTLVFSRLKWDEPVSLYSEGTARTVLIECLGHFEDEEAQLRIIELFSRHKDMYTEWEVKRVLGRLANQQKMTPGAIAALRAMLETEDSEIGWMHHRAVVSILTATRSREVLRSLVEEMNDIDQRTRDSDGQVGDTHAWDIAWSLQELLQEDKSGDAVAFIKECLADLALCDKTRWRLSEMLAKSGARVGLDFAMQTARSAAPLVVAQGIRMLSPYEFVDIAPELEKELRYCAKEPTGREDVVALGHRQEALVDVLVRHRKLPMLLQAEFRPKVFGLDGLAALLRAVVGQHLYELHELIVELADRSKGRIALSPRHAAIGVSLMTALFVLGDEKRAAELLQDVLEVATSNAFAVRDLIEATCHLPPERSLEILGTLRPCVVKPTSRYLEDDWVQAVERTGTRDACDLIVKCVEEMHVEHASDFHLERYLRALRSLGDVGMETWLIRLMEDSNLHGLARNRIFELLGMYGNENALRVLKEPHISERWPGAVFDAMQAIHLRMGRAWYSGWEEGR